MLSGKSVIQIICLCMYILFDSGKAIHSIKVTTFWGSVSVSFIDFLEVSRYVMRNERMIRLLIDG